MRRFKVQVFYNFIWIVHITKYQIPLKIQNDAVPLKNRQKASVWKNPLYCVTSLLTRKDDRPVAQRKNISLLTKWHSNRHFLNEVSVGGKKTRRQPWTIRFLFRGEKGLNFLLLVISLNLENISWYRIKNLASILLFIRKWHRDLGYFFVGLTLSFSLSGIALNHRRI